MHSALWRHHGREPRLVIEISLDESRLARDLIVNPALSVNIPDNADNTADKTPVLTAGMTAQ